MITKLDQFKKTLIKEDISLSSNEENVWTDLHGQIHSMLESYNEDLYNGLYGINSGNFEGLTNDLVMLFNSLHVNENNKSNTNKEKSFTDYILDYGKKNPGCKLIDAEAYARKKMKKINENHLLSINSLNPTKDQMFKKSSFSPTFQSVIYNALRNLLPASYKIDIKKFGDKNTISINDMNNKRYAFRVEDGTSISKIMNAIKTKFNITESILLENLYDNENENLNHFKSAWGEDGADTYRWKNNEHKEFWFMITKYLLRSERDINPNGYISELSEESQRCLVNIANQMYLEESNEEG